MSSIGIHPSAALFKSKELLKNSLREIDLEAAFPCLLDSKGRGRQAVEWVPVQDGGFIAADVIRWKEGVYAHRRGKGKSPRLGDRLVTAEVLNGPDRDGWVRLLVRKCEILAELSTRKPPSIAEKTEIRRAARTIMRGKPERMLWSDEGARAIVASKPARADQGQEGKKLHTPLHTKSEDRK